MNPKTQEGPQFKGNLSGQSIPGVVGKHSKQAARIQRLEFVVCEEQAITMPVSCPAPFSPLGPRASSGPELRPSPPPRQQAASFWTPNVEPEPYLNRSEGLHPHSRRYNE